MNKIERIALISKGFASDVVDAIIEVANATGNSTVAIEKLLGVYEAPKPVQYSYQHSGKEKVSTFVSFDPFKDQVTYSYMQEDTKWNETTRKHEPLGTYRKSQSTTSLHSWEYNALSQDEVLTYLESNS